MKIISISLDKKILINGSENQERQKKYGALCREYHVIVLSKQAMLPQKLNDSTWIYSTASKYKIFYIYQALRLAKSIGRPDIVSSQDPAFTGLIARRIAKLFKSKLHVQIHIDFFSPYFIRESLLNKIYVFLAHRVISQADGIRVVSNKIKDHLVSRLKIDPAKILVLPIRIDIRRFASVQPLFDLHSKYPQFKFIILMASRLVKQKNIDLAIAVVQDIIKNQPATGLVIVGSGPEEQQLKLKAINSPPVNKHGKLKTNIIFESWNNNLTPYYQTADLFLSTSNYEGWGLTAVEAMVAGCPILISNVGLAGELVFDGGNGLIFAVNSRNELIQKLGLLIDNAELRDRLRQRAFETVKSLPPESEYLKLYLQSWQNCFL